MTEDKAASKRPEKKEVPAANQPEDVPHYVTEEVYHFWKEHGFRLLIYAAVLLFGVVGFQVWKQISSGSDAKLRAEYAQLNEDQKLQFAKDKRSHPIAGYTFLKTAKDALNEGNYQESYENYDAASESLADTEFAGIIELGKAASLDGLGKDAEATIVLKELSTKADMPKAIRSEALFKLAAKAILLGDMESAEKWESALSELDVERLFVRRLEVLKNY